MCSVPTGALTNVLIRGDFHLKEIPFDHPKIGIFAKREIFTISSCQKFDQKKFVKKFLAVKNDVIEEFLPRARLQCPVQIGFLYIIAFERLWRGYILDGSNGHVHVLPARLNNK